MILKSTDDDLLDTIASFKQYVRMRNTKNNQQMIKKHNEDQSSTLAINHSELTFNEQATQENETRKSKKEKKLCVCDIMHK
jgi:hypothetical protein